MLCKYGFTTRVKVSTPLAGHHKQGSVTKKVSECRAQADEFGHLMAWRYMGTGLDHGLEICQYQSSSHCCQRRESAMGMTQEILVWLKLTLTAAFCILEGVQTVDHYCSNMELG